MAGLKTHDLSSEGREQMQSGIAILFQAITGTCMCVRVLTHLCASAYAAKLSHVYVLTHLCASACAAHAAYSERSACHTGSMRTASGPCVCACAPSVSTAPRRETRTSAAATYMYNETVDLHEPNSLRYTSMIMKLKKNINTQNTSGFGSSNSL